MRLQAADVQIHLLRQAEAMTADLYQVAGADERLDVPSEGGALFARNLENLKELADGRGMMHTLAHQREQVVA